MAEGLGNFHQLYLRHTQQMHGAGGVDVEFQLVQ